LEGLLRDSYHNDFGCCHDTNTGEIPMNLLGTIVTSIGAIFVCAWLLQWKFRVNRIVELLARIELHLSDKAQLMILDKLTANREAEQPATDQKANRIGPFMRVAARRE
jgi:hypothetical protein